MSTAAEIAVLIAGMLIAAFVLGTLAYSARRSWPQARAQRERIRRDGVPPGADFGSYIGREIDRLPVSGKDATDRDLRRLRSRRRPPDRD